MATYRSEAYDLSMYEPRAKITALPSKKATKADKRRARLQKLLNGAVTLAVAGVVLFTIAFMISNQVQLTEINSAISQAQDAYNQEVSETKRLESEQAAQTSAQSVKDYADAHGMRQVESGQIDYITVTPITPEAPQQEVGFWAKVWNALTAWF